MDCSGNCAGGCILIPGILAFYGPVIVWRLAARDYFPDYEFVTSIILLSRLFLVAFSDSIRLFRRLLDCNSTVSRLFREFVR